MERPIDNWGERNRRALLLAKSAFHEIDIQQLLAEKQKEMNERYERQRAAGHHTLAVEWLDGWIGSERCFIRLFENGDPARVDIFYGGVGQPAGDGHGHIVLRHGQVVSWFMPAPPGHPREQVY